MNRGPGILTLTGYGIDLRVERGHLRAEDGVADERRTRRLSKIEAPERVFVVGETGEISLGALRWIQNTGGSLVHMSHDGELVTSTAPQERRHAERIRAQALAQVNGGALPLSRELVASKIRGQRSVLARLPDSKRPQDKLERLADDCGEAGSGEELLTIEAKAANEYWSAWESLPVRFEDPERDGVPDPAP
jgi:CRISPR/Cas system-associated endonuclease Cas1